eukprot:COSAG01_NODE_30_length_36127_cov_41.433234_26_plen_80_part_00
MRISRGKGAWVPVTLVLDEQRRLTISSRSSSTQEGGTVLLRTADASGCAVGAPGSRRRNHPHAFRVDLRKGVKDNVGGE